VPLWRALTVFRLASLAYVGALAVRDVDRYTHPIAVGALVLLMIIWTGVTAVAYARPAWRRWPLLLVDLGVVIAIVLSSPWVVGRQALGHGVPTLGVAWMAGPVLAWAVSGGRRRGTVAALLVAGADLATRERISQSSFTGVILLLLAGVVVGHVARLAVTAEERLQHAVKLEAATRERERLARDIHDSVLQVLALVQRRGAHLPGEAGELARLAGEQEAALRSLVAGAPAAPDATHADLRALLLAYAGGPVSIAAPAHPVPVKKAVADELARAVNAALSNVTRHCGSTARAWVLLEVDGAGVTVTVRDDGPGIAAGRLEEAAAAGRLGVAQSIRGRIAELGGTVTISSSPGHGTEVELRVPLR
jgi:signal transduction histidine kinase